MNGITERIIVITAPTIIDDEVKIWVQLLQSGLQKLHIRKPDCSPQQIIKLIENVPAQWRSQLVIHQHLNVMELMQLGGVHLSYSQFNHRIKNNYSVSYSVHHWQEMETVIDHCDYAFISPVFDSLSKKGYAQNQSLQSVPKKLQHKKMYALGGINENNIHEVMSMGYYGAALLGSIWKQPATAVQQFQNMVSKYERL